MIRWALWRVTAMLVLTGSSFVAYESAERWVATTIGVLAAGVVAALILATKAQRSLDAHLRDTAVIAEQIGSDVAEIRRIASEE